MAYLNPIEMEERRLQTERARINAMANIALQDSDVATSGRAELEAGISPASPAPFGEITPESAEPFRYQPQVQPQTRLQQAQTGFGVQPNINVQQPNKAFLKGEDPQVPIRTGPNTAYLPGGSVEGGDRKLFIDADGTMTNFPTSRDVERFAVKVVRPTSADLVSNLRRGAAPRPISAPQTVEDWEIYEHETRSRNIDLSTVRIGAKGQRIGLTPEQQEADKARLITTYDPQEGEAQPKLNILAGESSPMTSSLLSGPYAKTMTNALIRVEYEFNYKVLPKLAGVRSVEDIDKLAKEMETYNPKLASQIKVMFERGLARANPELYDELGLSQFAESPLTQSDKDRVFDEKTGQTFGSEEASLRAEINVYRNATTPAQAAKFGEAQVKLNDLHKRVIEERSAAKSAVELGDAASLAKQVAGEDPEAADLAAKVYEGVATKEDLPYLHAEEVGAQISDESWHDVLSEEMVGTGAEGISRVVASKAVLSKQVAKDLTDRLAKGYSATAMHDSVKAVLSRYGKNAAVLFGKDVAQDYIKELVTASQGEYDKQAQEAYARMDARKVERMQTVIDEFEKTGPMTTTGDEELRYKAVQAKAQDLKFVTENEIGQKSGALDTAKDYLMADISLNWPELKDVANAYLNGNVNVVGASQVSGLLAANLTKFNTQLLSDTAKKMEESPEAMEVKRKAISDFNLKNRNLLTTFVEDPLSTDIAFTAIDDDVGSLEMQEYLAASPADRPQLRINANKRIAEEGKYEREADDMLNSLKGGFVTFWEARAIPFVGKVDPDEYKEQLVLRRKQPESEADWAEAQKYLEQFSKYPDVYNKIFPLFTEAKHKWDNEKIAGNVGYHFDDLDKAQQGKIEEIRQAEAINDRWFNLKTDKESELWKEFWAMTPEGKKDALSKKVLQAMPLQIEPDVTLDNAARESQVEPSKKVREVRQVLPDGQMGVFNEETGILIRREK